MQNEPLWLDRATVIRLNELIVASTNEPHALTRPNELDSALARPRNHFAYGETDVWALAVALMFGIANNHPFEQGNKRTGFFAADNFLQDNGYRLDMPDDEMVAVEIERVIERRVSEADFADRLRQYVVEII